MKIDVVPVTHLTRKRDCDEFARFVKSIADILNLAGRTIRGRIALVCSCQIDGCPMFCVCIVTNVGFGEYFQPNDLSSVGQQFRHQAILLESLEALKTRP